MNLQHRYPVEGTRLNGVLVGLLCAGGQWQTVCMSLIRRFVAVSRKRRSQRRKQSHDQGFKDKSLKKRSNQTERAYQLYIVHWIVYSYNCICDNVTGERMPSGRVCKLLFLNDLGTCMGMRMHVWNENACME